MDRKQKMKQGLQGGSIFSDTTEPRQERVTTPDRESFQTSTHKGKLRTYTERMTLPLSIDQVEFLQDFAMKARRPNKVKYLNNNSVIRALIEMLQEAEFSDQIFSQVEKEEDLKKIIKKIL